MNPEIQAVLSGESRGYLEVWVPDYSKPNERWWCFPGIPWIYHRNLYLEGQPYGLLTMRRHYKEQGNVKYEFIA
jgi:hypothetical protein